MGSGPGIAITLSTPLMPTDLSMWDMNPKSGQMPLTCSWVGYLIITGYQPIYNLLDGETVSLQIQAADGSWQETGAAAVTAVNPANGDHGYFAGQIKIDPQYTPPGVWNFRPHYGGNTAKGLEGCDDNKVPLDVTGQKPININPMIIAAGIIGTVALVGAGAYYASKKKS